MPFQEPAGATRLKGGPLDHLKREFGDGAKPFSPVGHRQRIGADDEISDPSLHEALRRGRCTFGTRSSDQVSVERVYRNFFVVGRGITGFQPLDQPRGKDRISLSG